MSRNLGQIDCDYCHGRVALCEAARAPTAEDMGAYLAEFANVRVAWAECEDCVAKYTAWVDGPGLRRPPDGTHADLSFRSTFNDEPGEADLPDFEMVRVRSVVEEHRRCGGKIIHERCFRCGAVL